MDNSKNQQSEVPYFTIGVGNLPAEQNVDTDANLSTTAQNSWRSEHDQRTIGSSAMFSSEQAPQQTEPVAPQKMGEITPLEPVTTPEAEQSAHKGGLGPDVIRMQGDNLSEGTLDLIKDEERQLSSTGDADSFVKSIGQMRASLSKSLKGDKAV